MLSPKKVVTGRRQLCSCMGPRTAAALLNKEVLIAFSLISSFAVTNVFVIVTKRYPTINGNSKKKKGSTLILIDTIDKNIDSFI